MVVFVRTWDTYSRGNDVFQLSFTPWFFILLLFETMYISDWPEPHAPGLELTEISSAIAENKGFSHPARP